MTAPEQAPSASALDRVLAAILAGVVPSAFDFLAADAQQELDQLREQARLREIDCANTEAENDRLRADLADVARLEAWLREKWAKEVAEELRHYDDAWDDLLNSRDESAKATNRSDLRERRSMLVDVLAQVETRFAALGAAVATEGK